MLRGYNFLVYNGVLLEIVKLVEFRREAVHDETTRNYLYTRNTLVVRATLAPSVSEHMIGARYRPNTAILQPTAAVGPAPVLPGARGQQDVLIPDPITGLESDAAIKHILLAPRNRLQYVDGGNYIIDCPHGTALTDANYGPIPLFCHVERVSGMSQVNILFGIQCDINQSPLFQGLPFSPAVLSHSYAQQIDIDENFRTRRQTKGKVVLRSDVALALGVVPDNFREYFAQSCPAYYKRDRMTVVAHPDMVTLEYSFLDSEQDRPIINGFDPTITYQLSKNNVEAPDRVIHLQPAVTRVATLKVKHRVIGGRQYTNVAQGVAAMPPTPEMNQILPEFLKQPGAVIAQIMGKPAENLKRTLELIFASMAAAKTPEERALNNLRYGMPTISEEITVDITGNPLSTRYELELIAWYIICTRAPIAARTTDTQFRDLMYAGGSTGFVVEHDVMANSVRMTFTYTRAAPQAFGLGAVLAGDDNRMRFGPMISGEQSIVGKEIIEGLTLHSYSANHYGDPTYDVPAVSLPDNVHNPWGRPGDRAHGTDPAPVIVDALLPQGGTPVAHDNATFERTPNTDASGIPMGRQPDTSIQTNLVPTP